MASAMEIEKTLATKLEKIHNNISGQFGNNEAFDVILALLADSFAIHPITEDRVQKECTPYIEPVQAWATEWIHAIHEELMPRKEIIDPIGRYYESIGRTNKRQFAQFFTPLTVVRMMCVMLEGEKNKIETMLDPCCGTGRFGLQAMVLDDNLICFNSDRDIHVYRIALVNFQAHFLGSRIWRILRCDSLATDLLLDSPNWARANKWNPDQQDKLAVPRAWGDKKDLTLEEFRKSAPKKRVKKIEAALKEAQKAADETGTVQLGLFNELK